MTVDDVLDPGILPHHQLLYHPSDGGRPTSVHGER